MAWQAYENYIIIWSMLVQFCTSMRRSHCLRSNKDRASYMNENMKYLWKDNDDACQVFIEYLMSLHYQHEFGSFYFGLNMKLYLIWIDIRQSSLPHSLPMVDFYYFTYCIFSAHKIWDSFLLFTYKKNRKGRQLLK